MQPWSLCCLSALRSWMYLSSQGCLDGGMCSHLFSAGWLRQKSCWLQGSGTTWHGPSPCAGPGHPPLPLVRHELPCQEKEECFGASWQLWGPCVIWPEGLTASPVCCVQESASGRLFLLTARQGELFQLEMLGSSLWETDYSQSCLTLLENRVGFVPLQLYDLQSNNICWCESPARQRTQSLGTGCSCSWFACRTDTLWEMRGESSVHLAPPKRTTFSIHLWSAAKCISAKVWRAAESHVSMWTTCRNMHRLCEGPCFTRVWTESHISLSNSPAVNGFSAQNPQAEGSLAAQLPVSFHDGSPAILP